MASCCNRKVTAATMAADLSRTAVSAMMQALKTGEILTHADVIIERLKICEAPCEHKRGVRCAQCGCFISLKVGIAVAKCPVGKW